MKQLPADLLTFLEEKRDSREYRRGLAVKLALQGYLYDIICDILDVTPGFISQSKRAYETHGVSGLLLKYKGPPTYLSPQERQEVVQWLHDQHDWSVDQLADHLEAQYGVVFQSRQSYYQLLAEADITHKKAQSRHPKADPAAVAAKKKRLKPS